MTTESALAREIVEHVLQVAGGVPTLRAIPFSDMFLISAVVPSSARNHAGTFAGTAGLVACIISYIVRETALQQVPLTFRGAIATGKCMIDPDNRTFIGPAVDEAATLMEKANGAFVLLTENAAELVENAEKSDYPRWRHDELWPDLFVDYEVPMKDGTRFSTKVANPFVHISHQAEEFNQIRLNYHRAMESDSEDVDEKRRNTEELFHHFERLSQEHWDRKKLVETLRTNHMRKT
jgi:hypothetical protein